MWINSDAIRMYAVIMVCIIFERGQERMDYFILFCFITTLSTFLYVSRQELMCSLFSSTNPGNLKTIQKKYYVFLMISLLLFYNILIILRMQKWVRLFTWRRLWATFSRDKQIGNRVKSAPLYPKERHTKRYKEKSLLVYFINN